MENTLTISLAAWLTFDPLSCIFDNIEGGVRNSYQIEPKIVLSLFSNFSDLEPKYSYQLYSMTSLGATYTIFLQGT